MNDDLQRVFRDIHDKNKWQSAETVSGLGSELTQTATLLAELQRLLARLAVQTLLDIPCGDHHWIRSLEVPRYIGADILPELVARNLAEFGGDFRVLDITTDPLPRADLVLCRDLFGHLSDRHVLAALQNVERSGSSWLACTTFTSTTNQPRDTDAGWRPLNLLAAPYHLRPVWLFNEQCTEGDGRFDDKCVGVFDVSRLTCGRFAR
ncbi:MAG: class I SAM-dependent methyltransferase [Vicinamibacterales bacterium]